jgi:predicted RNA-binding Zn-ribbon protein involved in translation (DUF1610 family)
VPEAERPEIGEEPAGGCLQAATAASSAGDENRDIAGRAITLPCMSDDYYEGEGEGPEGALEEEAEVTCPHCGEVVVIVLDRSAGSRQDYVQDCEVCCRPWHVQVHFAGGAAEVSVEAA